MTTKRPRYIGASEVSALFDANSYLTKFQLWHIKAGLIQRPPFVETEEAWWGNRLEQTIAAGWCERNGFELSIPHPEQRFRIHPTIRQCAANLDFRYIDKEGNKGLLEVKMSRYDQYMQNFPNGNLPLAYELQLQQEMMCDAKTFGHVIVMIGGSQLEPYPREYRPAIGEIIEEAIEAFWKSIDNNEPPKPDFTRDGKAIAKLLFQRDGTAKDWRGNNYLNNLCADYKRYAEQESAAARLKDAAKAEIIHMTGRTTFGYTDGYELKLSQVEAVPLNYTRKAYLNLTISERKTKS